MPRVNGRAVILDAVDNAVGGVNLPTGRNGRVERLRLQIVADLFSGHGQFDNIVLPRIHFVQIHVRDWALGNVFTNAAAGLD